MVWQQLGFVGDRDGKRASKNLTMHKQIIIIVEPRVKENRKHVGDGSVWKADLGGLQNLVELKTCWDCRTSGSKL